MSGVAGVTLFDTNVVSELMKPSHLRNPSVDAWFSRVPLPLARVPAVVHFEIRFGIRLIPSRKTRDETLQRYAAFRGLVAGMADLDEAAAEATAEFMEHRRRHGRRMDDQLADAQIAGTAVVLSRKSGRVTLATRNLADFALLAAFAAVDVLDPFTGRRG